MILPCPKDALHKAMLLRLLSGILDNAILSSQLFFKGGTAAAMLGWLNRFSLDLDFDLAYQADKPTIEKQLRQVFRNLNFIIKEKATNELFYVLKYPASASQRQYLKLSIMS